MAQTLQFLQERDIRSYDVLSERANGSAAKFNELSQTIKDAEKRLGEIAVLRTHIINYAKTKEVYTAYRKAGYSKKFFEAHREDITIHKVAKDAFSSLPCKKIPKVKELDTEYAEVLAKKKAAYAEYRQAKKRCRILLRQNTTWMLSLERRRKSRSGKSKER